MINKPNTNDIHALGNQLAKEFNWDGRAIFLAAIVALTDANFHKACHALIEAWEKTEGPLNV